MNFKTFKDLKRFAKTNNKLIESYYVSDHELILSLDSKGQTYICKKCDVMIFMPHDINDLDIVYPGIKRTYMYSDYIKIDIAFNYSCNELIMKNIIE